MARAAAGLLLFRRKSEGIEVLLVHPGGPLWMRKDDGAWSIPKGEIEVGEAPLRAAQREFEEELGFKAGTECIPLTSIRQKSGKIVHAWACQGDLDTSRIKSNTFKMEWPPRSGLFAEFPEVDRAEFFGLEAAKEKINPAQAPLLDELREKLAARS